MKSAFLAFIASLFFILPSFAQTYSGIWSDPKQPGNGFSIEHNSNSILLVWTGNSANGTPFWYTGTFNSLNGSRQNYTGTISVTQGTGAAATQTQLGTAILNFPNQVVGELTVTIPGASNFFTIQRATVGALDISGNYEGVEIVKNTTCSDVTAGTVIQKRYVIINLGQNNYFFVNQDMNGTTCFLSGDVQQYGSFLRVINGQYTCPSDGSGIVDTMFINTGALIPVYPAKAFSYIMTLHDSNKGCDRTMVFSGQQ
jgi:hypothetical protein